MTDPKTVFMGLGNNRTLANLKENPWAAYMIMEPGNSLPEWKGVRLYLKATEIDTEGNKLEQIRAHHRRKSRRQCRQNDPGGRDLRGAGDKAPGRLRAGLGEIHLGDKLFLRWMDWWKGY